MITEQEMEIHDLEDQIAQLLGDSLCLDWSTASKIRELEERMQALLPISDPRHKKMFRIDDERRYAVLHWGNYEYDLDLDPIQDPEDLIWAVDHVASKTWRHTTGRRVALLMREIALLKGWKPFSKVRPKHMAPVPKRRAIAQRAKMTPQVRYKVIMRDGYRCRCCGASVETGAILHVDHVVPVSKGGRTEMGNLQTLCSACNAGKGATA